MILLRDVEVEGERVDVRVADGVVTEVGEGLAVPAGVDAEIVEGDGCALVPGLHDHHVHLLAIAARRAGVDVDTCATPADFDAAIRTGAVAVVDGWLRVAGHDEHRHGEVDRRRLDMLAPGAKVRVQHRTGLAWTLSSAALDAIDRTDVTDGRLLRVDDWLATRVDADLPSLDGLGAELAALGITGVTDATPTLGPVRRDAIRDAVRGGHLPQRIVLLGLSDDEADRLDEWAVAGPAKLLADEVLGLDPDALALSIARHHEADRPVAIHAVSRAETVAAVTALALAGPLEGDRIEHGSVLPTDLDAILAAARVTVVVQPSLVHERGDHHLTAVDGDDLPFLHRLASLRDAGVPIIAGSDAPVTSVDPWAAMRAAMDRTTRSGAVVGANESLTAAAALGLFLADPLRPAGPHRRVRPGARADLMLLDEPLGAVLAAPDRRHVRRTWVQGRLVHG